VNVMMAAGEVVAEFVNEQDCQQGEREGQAGEESERMFVKEREGV